ncbi:cupin domain-containing protein [Larkinella soli]|uniref:cupin domain-containing protein n=1 Tax=Larkinella soli TaxID=1770527 RepID=UPI000FFB4318|nr:cupin domain-containing protein [Larkinella soli]
MERRAFLRFPLSASILAFFGRPPLAPVKGFKVEAGKDRFSNSLSYIGARFDLKVSGKDTNGAISVYETTRYEKRGPVLHIHPDLDEWFYVLDGEFKFRLGDEILYLKTGDSLFGPRGIPHAFVKISEGPARLLLHHQPAGRMEEQFFEGSQMKNPTIAEREASMRKYNIIPVGPPLSPD